MYGDKFSVYHLNSDLFALVAGEDNFNNIVKMVENIKEDISKLNIVTDNFNKTIETTIGVAHQSENDVMQKAELALKEARNKGRNQIRFYSNDLEVIKEISNTHHWSPIIKKALETNSILAYAQPIYDARDNTIFKYELLVRLKHEGTVYSPFHFLPAANYSGQLYNIFKFMFNEACRLAKKNNNRYSVNVGNSEFDQEDFIEFMSSTLAKHGVDPELISLEILESNSLTQSQEILDKVNDVEKLGIEFVIDDFGVEGSNFSQTEFLPATTLKIDGSFIKNIDQSFNSKIIVKTIKTFAQEKGLKLVAEFVHSKEVYDIVKELGVDYMQGYYLGEPAEIND